MRFIYEIEQSKFKYINLKILKIKNTISRLPFLMKLCSNLIIFVMSLYICDIYEIEQSKFKYINLKILKIKNTISRLPFLMKLCSNLIIFVMSLYICDKLMFCQICTYTLIFSITSLLSLLLLS